MSGEKLFNCEDFLTENEPESSGTSSIAGADQEDLSSPGETNSQSENTTEDPDDNALGDDAGSQDDGEA